MIHSHQCSKFKPRETVGVHSVWQKFFFFFPLGKEYCESYNEFYPVAVDKCWLKKVRFCCKRTDKI